MNDRIAWQYNEQLGAWVIEHADGVLVVTGEHGDWRAAHEAGALAGALLRTPAPAAEPARLQEPRRATIRFPWLLGRSTT